MPEFAPLEITPIWALVNDELIELVDLISDDQLDWSAKPELWNFKGILLHVAFGRHGMMGGAVQDGKEMPDVLALGQTKEGLQEQLRVSLQRMEPFLRDPQALAREYDVQILSQKGRLNGHAMAFGQLEHDIHHRADILHYLRELGISHSEPDTLERVLRAGTRRHRKGSWPVTAPTICPVCKRRVASPRKLGRPRTMHPRCRRRQEQRDYRASLKEKRNEQT